MQEVLPGISAEAAARAALPFEAAWTLPPAAYIRDDLYALETERIFRRSWLPVARLDQVPQPGDFLTVDVAGQPALVVRGADGEVRVMSAICLHRAALLVEGSGRRKLFTCPYHSWAYDTTGALVAAPLMEGAAGFQPQSCRLPQIRTEVWEGFVMANLDPQARPFAPQVKGLGALFSGYDLAGMVVARTLTYESEWNWKVLVENFMEAYHHIGPHAHTFEPVFHAQDSSVTDSDGPWSGLRMPPSQAHGSPDALVRGLGPEQRGVLFAALVFPHFMFAPHDNGMAWYQVFPRSAGELTLKIHVCVPAYARELDEFEAIVDASAAFTDHVHQEDISANDRVWRGLNAPLTGQGRLSPLERAIWQMNQRWLGAMTERA